MYGDHHGREMLGWYIGYVVTFFCFLEAFYGHDNEDVFLALQVPLDR